MSNSNYLRLSRALKACLGMLLTAQSVIVLANGAINAHAIVAPEQPTTVVQAIQKEIKIRLAERCSTSDKQQRSTAYRNRIIFAGIEAAFVPVDWLFDPFMDVTAGDLKGNDLTRKVAMFVGVDTSKPGYYYLNYIAIDSLGGMGYGSPEVVVEALNTPPVFKALSRSPSLLVSGLMPYKGLAPAIKKMAA